MTEQTIAKSIKQIQIRISKTTLNNNRSVDSVCLIAVSKKFSIYAIREAYQAGCKNFGENYAQEFKEKVEQLNNEELIWHFIGPLQSNKTGIVAKYATWVHSVDRIKIAKRLSDQRPAAMPPLNVCLQVNISAEATKSGCHPINLPSLAKSVADLPHLRLRGLMGIPSQLAKQNELALQFEHLQNLYHQLCQAGFSLDTLSMGMSNDLEIAIAKGATHVRIGTAIFGERSYEHKKY